MYLSSIRAFAIGLAFVFVSLLATPLCYSGETVISDSKAAAHVGEQVTVRGTIANVFTSSAGNTFLNFGKPFPNQTFYGVIFRKSAGNFEDPTRWEGKEVLMSGMIELYKGRPQIILKTADQLRLAK